jgi:hypothetical protein
MEERLRELEVRLARAERRERATRWGGLAVLGAALALVAARPAVTQTLPNFVKAPFQVIDGTGKPLLEVAAGPSGARVGLYDAAGKVAASLYTDADGGNLRLRNRGGQDILSIGFLASQHGGVVDLKDNEGKQVALLFANADGGTLTLRSKGGRDVVQLFSTPEGDGKIGVYDRTGKAVLEKP